MRKIQDFTLHDKELCIYKKDRWRKEEQLSKQLTGKVSE